LLQGELPVLDLGVAREQELLLADLEKQDDARVVHLLVKRAHNLQQLLAARHARVIDKPTGVDGKGGATALHMARKQHRDFAVRGSGEPCHARLKLPEFVRNA
jgi:hypothetical protein